MISLSDQVAAVERERDRLAAEKAAMTGALVELAKGYRPVPMDPHRLVEVARKRLRHLEAMEEMAEGVSVGIAERNESANLLREEQARRGVLDRKLRTEIGNHRETRAELADHRRQVAFHNRQTKDAQLIRDIYEGWFRRNFALTGPLSPRDLADLAQRRLDKLRGELLAKAPSVIVAASQPAAKVWQSGRIWLAPGELPVLLGHDNLAVAASTSRPAPTPTGIGDQVAVEVLMHGTSPEATIDIKAWISTSDGIRTEALRFLGPRTAGRTLAFVEVMDTEGRYLTRKGVTRVGPVATRVQLVRMHTAPDAT